MKWLKAIRRDRHLTQSQVAHLSHVAQSTYANIEAGRKRPSIETARSIAAALGFTWTRFYEEGEQKEECI